MGKPVWIVVGLCLICALLIFFYPWDSNRNDVGDPVDQGGRFPPPTSTGPGESQPREGRLPKIVPPLDCIPSLKDGQGSARLSPAGPVPISSIETFELSFTTGEHGIVPGGFIIFQVSPWWGWTPPQSQEPGRPGYTEVTTSFEDPSLKIYTLKLNRILVFSEARSFEPGDTVTFRYGPARVDRFAEGEEIFQLFVDADGDGHYACIENPPRLRILPAAPAHLAVNVPSRAVPNEEIEISAFALDPVGNWAPLPEGAFTLRVFLEDQELDALKASKKKSAMNSTMNSTLKEEGQLLFRFTLPGEGIYFFEVESASGLEGRSNVLLCQAGSLKLNLYFGDIHGHTRLSDGTGTPEDYYRFAREVSGLQIAAVTDHADYGTIPFKGKVWERIKKATNEANEPDRFVTFVGFEWTNWVFGHRNVYYRDGDGPVFRSIDSHSDTPQELWKCIDAYEAMTVAHHVGGGPIHTDWSIPPGPKEWLVEISSVHGSSEVYRGENCIYSPVQGAFVRDALNRGYKLGIIGSGDTHDGHPGKRSVGAVVNGLMGVYSEELTRNAVWDAFKRRHVYGTSGPKIILFFRVADAPMGSEVKWPREKGPLPIALRAVGCEEIARLEIIRNGEVAFRAEGGSYEAQLLMEDPDPPAGENWYYARIIQEDGNMAWSSPVWVTRE